MHRSHCRFFAAVGIALGATEMAMANDERERERQEAYCAALSKAYTRYVAQSRSHPVRPEVVASVAMADCEEGETADAIPVLEQRLTNAKVKLPTRP
jgi:hypothetical protein